MLEQLIRVPTRLAIHARQLTAHLPRDWPWQQARMRLWQTAHGPPGTATI